MSSASSGVRGGISRRLMCRMALMWCLPTGSPNAFFWSALRFRVFFRYVPLCGTLTSLALGQMYSESDAFCTSSSMVDTAGECLVMFQRIGLPVLVHPVSRGVVYHRSPFESCWSSCPWFVWRLKTWYTGYSSRPLARLASGQNWTWKYAQPTRGSHPMARHGP